MKRAHRLVHRRLWLVLAALLPLAFLIALGARQDGPIESQRFNASPPASAIPQHDTDG